MAGRGTTRADVLRRARDLGWTVEPPGKRGYRDKLKCPCGKHITWLSKTPSNPNYWFERIKFLERACSVQ